MVRPRCIRGEIHGYVSEPLRGVPALNEQLFCKVRDVLAPERVQPSNNRPQFSRSVDAPIVLNGLDKTEELRQCGS